MSINEIKDVLLWCAIINYIILLVWFGVFMFARDWLYGIHSRWFKLPIETFDAIHYSCMAIYKIGVLLLNLVPLFALHVVYR